jgi:hypothetical protein
MYRNQESRDVSREQGQRVCALMIAVVLGLGVSAESSAQVSVSSGGTPSYGVNIPVPPGIAGMSPNLSLVYTGGGVNGPVGYGWTLTGVSLITRCNGNLAADGTGIAVAYAPGDRLCLDGQRLIQTDAGGVPVAASPAANGALLDANGRAEDGSYTEYRTEKDIYSRIRAYGMANGVAANGPRYFKVWTKAGQIYEYGAGPAADANSNALITPYGGFVAAAWAVSRIADTVGNFIDFKYAYRDIAWGSGPSAGPTTGHEWNLAEVQYTGHGSQLATNKVVFEYEDRPDTPGYAQDRSEAYHRGYKNVSVARLKAVRTYVNWPSTTLGVTMPGGALATPPSTAVKVKTLKIGYEHGPTSGRSRVITTQECAGSAETACLPKTTVAYAQAPSSDAYIANTVFAGGTLSTTQLQNASGTMGVLLGDFNGDGRMDIIRWSDTPSQNAMYTSNGDGSFAPASAFNLASVQLFKSDGCYASIAMDFNGDGLIDLLRVMQPTSLAGATCGTPVNLLYLSKGDGSFAAPIALPASISFKQTEAVRTKKLACNAIGPIGAAGQSAKVQEGASSQAIGSAVCSSYSYTGTAGANYHLLDVNGDGLLDIVTTIVPAYSDEAYLPTPDFLCKSVTCTQIFSASFNGMTAGPNAVPSVTFAPLATNMTNHSVYGPPRPLAQWSPRFHPYVADFDGDGLQDLQVDSGGWRSLGNGSFQVTATNYGCQYPLDFNGDTRADCLLLPSPMSANSMNVGNGSDVNTVVASFNLAAAGVLTPTASPVPVGSAIGVVLADLDGDGRTDIIRWADDPTQDMAFLSNGDGTFHASDLLSKLSSTASPLQKSDGSVSFLTGDFTGNGQTEILRMASTIAAGSPTTTNQLFVRPSAMQPEELGSITPPSGLKSTVTFVSLLNSSSPLGLRYQPGRTSGSPAVYPKIDMSVPVRVVETVETATGVGSLTKKDEYAYGSLRATFDGHGFLGFQTVREQHSAADGNPLTTVTSYLQDGAYIGVAGTTRTLDGALNATSAPVISRTTNSYCDTTSTASPMAITTPGTAPAPCTTTSLVQRPYLYQSLEEGWDIDASRTALPVVTTTNAFNGSGDATQVSVSTSGTALGLSQTVNKVTSNSFFPANTSGDNWILGRLQQSAQTNTVPYSLASITTSAGTAKYASATTGEALGATLSVPAFPTTYLGQTSTVNATLQNTSSGPLSVTPPTAASVTGTDFSFVSTTCTSTLAQSASCTVTVKFAPTAAVARTGTLKVQNEAMLSSAGLSGLGALSPVALALSNCASTTPTITPTPAKMTCQLGNTGQTAASSVAYSTSVAGVTASGPATCPASTSNCGSVIVTTPTTANSYVGTLFATPSSGGGASAGFNLSVVTPAALSFSCTSTTTNMTCALSNTGGSIATGIKYASTDPYLFSFGDVDTCAAKSACGSIVLTPGSTTPGTESGTFTATPASGSAASVAYSFNIPYPPTMALTSCSQQSPMTTPSHATMTCSVVNNGDTAASSLAYSVPSGLSVSGPTGACAGHTTCGSVTVSTTTSGTFTGSLVVTPNSGSAASQAINLTQSDPPAALSFSCTSTATNMTCALSNTGGGAATGIKYASTDPYLFSFGGVDTCAPQSACGSIVLTPGSTTPGTESGTFTATPASGTAASVAFSFNIPYPPNMALTSCSQQSPMTTPSHATMTCSVVNNGDTAATSLAYSVPSGLSVSGPTGACAGHSTCGSVTVSTTTSGTFTGSLVVTPSSGSAASQAINLTQSPPPVVQFTFSAPSVTRGNPELVSWTVSNPNPTTVAIVGVDVLGGLGDVTLSGTCTTAGSIAANGTCTLKASALQDCAAYNFAVTVSNAAGAAQSGLVNVPGPIGSCNRAPVRPAN